MNTPLNHKTGNGATVSDWLGTAAVAAAGAATILTRIRSGQVVAPEALQNALDRLAQASDEVAFVQAEVERMARVTA